MPKPDNLGQELLSVENISALGKEDLDLLTSV